MPRRKFAKLKAAMYEAGITQPELARATGKQIGTLLHIDRAQWLDYFMESL